MQRLGSVEISRPGCRPLVLLPGWGTNGSFLLPIARMFEDRPVLLIDLPGYGKSAHLSGFANDFSGTVRLLLNTLPANCDLLSWSLSTPFAIKVCSLAPQRINSLITVCGTPRFPRDPNWPGMSSTLVLKCQRLLTPHRCERLLRFFFKLQAIDAGTGSGTGSGDFLFLLERLRHSPLPSYSVLMAGIKQMAALDLRQEFKYLKVPCLHLFGAADRLVPPALAQKVQISPLHQSYVFEHSAHNPYLTEPQTFERVIRGFLESLETIKKVSRGTALI